MNRSFLFSQREARGRAPTATPHIHLHLRGSPGAAAAVVLFPLSVVQYTCICEPAVGRRAHDPHRLTHTTQDTPELSGPRPRTRTPRQASRAVRADRGTPETSVTPAPPGTRVGGPRARCFNPHCFLGEANHEPPVPPMRPLLSAEGAAPLAAMSLMLRLPRA